MADTAKALGAGITIDPSQISRPSCGAGTVYDLASGQCLALASANLGVGSCDAALTLAGGKTAKACCDAGGNVVSGTGGAFLCKVSGSSCPTGWSKYQNWTTTAPQSCLSYDVRCDYDGNCPATVCSSCSTAQHAFANTAPETCAYSTTIGGSGPPAWSGCTGSLGNICKATTLEVGCQ